MGCGGHSRELGRGRVVVGGVTKYNSHIRFTRTRKQMGACGGKAADVQEPGVAEQGNTARRRTSRLSSIRKSKSGTLARSSKPKEEDSRSIIGKLMQEHTSDGRCFYKEYDDSRSQTIGSGMSGSVVTARSRKTGVTYAVKTLNIEMMGVDGMAELRKEVAAMRRLDHPNIVRLFETFEEPETGSIHMVLELCLGGELVQRMMDHEKEGMPEFEAARLVSKMLSALRHCHEHDVVHRDVKLDNFVYEGTAEDAELKLIDFGLSHLCQRGGGGSEAMSGRVGTLSYMAPEVLQRLPYTAACDMWSLGVVTFILLSGRRPFHSRDRAEKIERILHTEPNYDHPAWSHVSAEGVDFVQRLLAKRPAERMTAVEAMSHDWITITKAHSGPEANDPSLAIRKHAVVLRSMQVFSSGSHPAPGTRHPAPHPAPVTLRSMQAFSSASQMEKVALELLAFATPSTEVDEMRRVFMAIDSDGSGTISREEFASAMRAHPQLSSSAVTSLFNDLNFSKSGDIGYNEFLAATLGNHLVS